MDMMPVSEPPNSAPSRSIESGLNKFFLLVSKYEAGAVQ